MTPESLRELAHEVQRVIKVLQVGWPIAELKIRETPEALRSFAAHLEADGKDAARLDSNCIVIDSDDEFGDPLSTHHYGINLRAAIDAAMQADGKEKTT